MFRIRIQSDPYFFGAKGINWEKLNIEFSVKSDVYVVLSDGEIMIQSIGVSNTVITIIPSKKKKKISKELEPAILSNNP